MKNIYHNMNLIFSTCILLFLSLFQSSIYSQEKMDEYNTDSSTITVYFYDPFNIITNNNPNFDSLPDEQKIDIWYNVLHNSVIYIFSVNNKQKNNCISFCLSGNPSITNSASFYKLDVYKCDSSLVENPNLNRSKLSIIKTYSIPNIRGSLFEHCVSPDKRKELAGNGIQMYGKFVKVIPYEEIKKYINEKIDEYFLEE